MNRFEIEMKVNDIVDEIADEYEVDKNFYGDCYPDEVMKLENRIEREKDNDERNRMFDEIREIFKEYI